METGTVMVAVNDPVVDVVTVVGEVVTVVPSYLIVMVDEAANPLPVTVTLDPVMLLVGLILMDALIVKVADELSDATSNARTV